MDRERRTKIVFHSTFVNKAYSFHCCCIDTYRFFVLLKMSLGHRVQYGVLALLSLGTAGGIGTMLYMKKQGTPVKLKLEVAPTGESDVFSALQNYLNGLNEKGKTRREEVERIRKLAAELESTEKGGK